MTRVLELQNLDGGVGTQTISTVSPWFCASSTSIILCIQPAENDSEQAGR
jgi:hypothetical protein